MTTVLVSTVVTDVDPHIHWRTAAGNETVRTDDLADNLQSLRRGNYDESYSQIFTAVSWRSDASSYGIRFVNHMNE